MSTTNADGPGESRPKTLHSSRSFTRMEPPPPSTTSPRKRASTMQPAGIPTIPEARNIESSTELMGKSSKADVFENAEDEEHEDSGSEAQPQELKLPNILDELPIEIKSLTERFLDGLFAKVHPAPLTADNLSDMFQDFYEQAAAQISVHIATLASRIGREKTSPAAPSSYSAIKGRQRAGSGAKRGDSPSGGEMLTASEVTDRKKARRKLELKRLALEEAVERGVCEKVYDRIYKHRSTDDEARDEKLRSRTAALALVGIGLKELHMDQDPEKEVVRQTAEEKGDEIFNSLAPAREALQLMNKEHYPLGKLQHLTAVHKSIVETLSQLFPSSSSADEILPTLIYTLITSPPSGVNVVSNLSFIQRFRAQSKVDGEAAYCLVNLEAAISFLETVDLSSLRADELPEGPPKSTSRPQTPTNNQEVKPPQRQQPLSALSPKPELSPISVVATEKSSPSNPPSSPGKLQPSTNRPGVQPRRLSHLVSNHVQTLENSKDSFLATADKVYENINGTLENSLKFVFGRFKDQIGNAADSSPLPKTLEDARRLVSSPTTPTPEDDDVGTLNLSGRSTPTPVISSDDPLSTTTRSGSISENKMLELLGGRKLNNNISQNNRDRSVDSTRSAGSGKRVAFDSLTTSNHNNHKTTIPLSSAAQQQQQKEKDKEGKADDLGAQAANFITSINPLNRFGVPGFPRFGRSVSGTSTTNSNANATPSPPSHSHTDTHPTSLAAIDEKSPGRSRFERTMSQNVSNTGAAGDGTRGGGGAGAGDDVSTGGDDLNAIEALASLKKLKPPRKRFLEISSAAELKLGEVEELLMEYRRLAKAIGEAIAS